MSQNQDLQVRINGRAVDPDTLELSEYRKRPVVVKALCIDESFEVDTLEGTMKGNPGDYLIQGINREFYPCKPDIFHKTYDKENL